MFVRTDLLAGKGLGDVVADFTHLTGLDRLADWYSDVTRQDCGCSQRQDALNQLVPDVPFTA
jgi:hypothetical protein